MRKLQVEKLNEKSEVIPEDKKQTSDTGETAQS